MGIATKCGGHSYFYSSHVRSCLTAWRGSRIWPRRERENQRFAHFAGATGARNEKWHDPYKPSNWWFRYMSTFPIAPEGSVQPHPKTGFTCLFVFGLRKSRLCDGLPGKMSTRTCCLESQKRASTPFPTRWSLHAKRGNPQFCRYMCSSNTSQSQNLRRVWGLPAGSTVSNPKDP